MASPVCRQLLLLLLARVVSVVLSGRPPPPQRWLGVQVPSHPAAPICLHFCCRNPLTQDSVSQLHTAIWAGPGVNRRTKTGLDKSPVSSQAAVGVGGGERGGGRAPSHWTRRKKDNRGEARNFQSGATGRLKEKKTKKNQLGCFQPAVQVAVVMSWKLLVQGAMATVQEQASAGAPCRV